jgi:hypothetical protein
MVFLVKYIKGMNVLEEDLSKINKLKKENGRVLKWEETKWKEKCRTTWLIEWDKTTK